MEKSSKNTPSLQHIKGVYEKRNVDNMAWGTAFIKVI